MFKCYLLFTTMKDVYYFLWFTNEEAGSYITSLNLCQNPFRVVLLWFT